MKETLVLSFKNPPTDIKTKVYRETLKYIGNYLPTAEVYQFYNNQALLRFVKKRNFASVIFTEETPLDTAFLLKGCGLVQVLIGITKELVDTSDIIVDPLVLKSEKYLVGPRYLLPSILAKIPAKALANIIGVGETALTEETNHNDAEAELLDIAKLYRRLDWDSRFFGINIGYLSCLRLTPNIERHVKKFIREEKIDLMEYLCNCHDRESVVTSEKSGYSFVDMRLAFEQFIHKKIDIENSKYYNVKKASRCDIPKLKKIATDIYKYSRYYFDSNFDRKKVIEFYVNWVEKAVNGQFDDFAYALYNKKKPIGFCTIKKIRKNGAKIGLFGLDAEYNGKGLATHLLNSSLRKLKDEEDVNHVEVVTQGRNYAAQRLYQKCGFATKSTELWYHKWFR